MDFFIQHSIPENWAPPSLAATFLEQIFSEIPENLQKKAGISIWQHSSPWRVSLLRYQSLCVEGNLTTPNESPRFSYPQKHDKLFVFLQKILGEQKIKPSLKNPRLEKLVKNCWKKLKSESGIDSAVVCALAPDLIFVDGPEFGSASHPHLFGAIIFSSKVLEKRGQAAVTRALIHEMAHQEIFLLNLIDPLIVLKTAETQRIYAPYQKKMRPPMGLVHATHALFRMLQYDKRESQEYAAIYDVFRQSLDQAKHLELSKIGKDIFQKYNELCP